MICEEEANAFSFFERYVKTGLCCKIIFQYKRLSKSEFVGAHMIILDEVVT